MAVTAASDGLAAARVNLDISTMVLAKALDAQATTAAELVERSLGPSSSTVGRLLDVQA